MYEVIIIGAGLYGCMVALYFRSLGKKVLIVEQSVDILQGASANNQARVHNGYHYPRNYLTALSSHRNYQKFIQDFRPAIIANSFNMNYAIAKGSKTSVKDFIELYKKIGAPLTESSTFVKSLFNPSLVEAIFSVEESVFDANILRDLLRKRLNETKVDIVYGQKVEKILEDCSIKLEDGKVFKGQRVISCVYANINKLLALSNLEELPIKVEVTKMPLVKVPNHFQNIGITIMDGDFFSIMPFPKLGIHSIHHVKFTPQENNFEEIRKDVIKFIPSLAGMKYRGCVPELKAVLLQNEVDDGRPILFKKDYGFKGFDVILGGKLDNIYDILEKFRNERKPDLNVVTN